MAKKSAVKTPAKKQVQKVSEFDKTLSEIRKLVLKDKGFVEQKLQTGYSYFKGNTRLLKLVQTAKGIVMEINTDLPEELANLAGMREVAREEARSKHLGTMKYLYEAQDAKDVKKIVQAALKEFRIESAAMAN